MSYGEHTHHHDHDEHDEHDDHEHKHAAYEVHPCDMEGHEHHHHADGSCCCEHHAQEFHGVERPVLYRLIAAAVLYLCGRLLPLGETPAAVLMIASAVLSGYDVVLSAGKNIVKLRFFDEYFLMSFAAIAAFVIGEFEEGAAVFLLYRIGEFCQSYAIRHSKKTISNLAGDYAGDSQEARPHDQFLTRFARVYTPVILALALVIAVGLPLVSDASFRDSVYRALTFLVLACPCAIVISVPLAYFAGIAAASRKSIFFRDAVAIDLVAKRKPDALALQELPLDAHSASCFTLADKPDVKTAELVLAGERDCALAVAIAKKTHLIAQENVYFTILIKIAVLILAVCGVSALWFAVFADSGVMLLAVLNSMRAFHARTCK